MAGFETDLGRKFAPTYHSSRGEGNCLVQLEPQREPTFAQGFPPWLPLVYFSVCLLGTSGGERLYEINYLTIWEWDTGISTPLGVQGSHQWDTERCAVLVAGPQDGQDLAAFTARQAYFAAHEEVRVGPWSLDNSRYLKYRRLRHSGPDVYWSKGKHASFVGLEELRRSTTGDRYDKPGRVARPDQYRLADVGTLSNPSADSPWIMYAAGWGEQRISPVYDKLKERLWDASGDPLRPIRRLTEDEVRGAQAELEAAPTGQFDGQTLQQAVARLPADEVWTTEQAHETDSQLKAGGRTNPSRSP